MILFVKAREIRAAYDVEFALLFSSFARETPQPWTDVDSAVDVSRLRQDKMRS